MLLLALLLGACGHGRSSECHGLELGDCRTTDGCAVDSCDLCSCTPQYRGCLAAFEVPTACPAVGCASPTCCEKLADCTDTTSCLPPLATAGCGACNQDPGNCTNDAMCKPQGASMICEPIACSCDGKQACVAGCISDSTCGEGQQCDFASARCVPRMCDAANACPEDFDCTATGCARRTCTEDLECDHFCVEGQCFSGRGECVPPAG